MSNGIFTGTIIQAKDGSLSFDLQSLRVRDSKRFTPAQLLPLKDWLASAKTSWPSTAERPPSQRISYSHETDEIRLETSGGVEYYSASSDEALAKLVRRLKRAAPVPANTQPALPSLLPEVTAEDLRTKRTVYAQAQAAAGAKKPKKRKSQTVKTKTSDEEASKLLDAILFSGL